MSSMQTTRVLRTHVGDRIVYDDNSLTGAARVAGQRRVSGC